MIKIEALTTDQTGTVLANVLITASPMDIALLPKSVRFTKWNQVMINFRSNGSNGGVNETGSKRIRALLKGAAKHSIGVVFAQPAYFLDELNAPLWGFGMRYITRTELEALLP